MPSSQRDEDAQLSLSAATITTIKSLSATKRIAIQLSRFERIEMSLKWLDQEVKFVSWIVKLRHDQFCLCPAQMQATSLLVGGPSRRSRWSRWSRKDARHNTVNLTFGQIAFTFARLPFLRLHLESNSIRLVCLASWHLTATRSGVDVALRAIKRYEQTDRRRYSHQIAAWTLPERPTVAAVATCVIST